MSKPPSAIYKFGLVAGIAIIVTFGMYPLFQLVSEGIEVVTEDFEHESGELKYSFTTHGGREVSVSKKMRYTKDINLISTLDSIRVFYNPNDYHVNRIYELNGRPSITFPLTVTPVVWILAALAFWRYLL